MTLHLSAEQIRQLVTPEIALAAAAAGVDAEVEGATALPGRIDTPSGTGFLRVMPAVLGDVMGLKVMTLVEGVGNRYLVLLYSVSSGELLGLFDADELTRMRTAAYTAHAAKIMVQVPPKVLGVVGTGFEAAGHLRMLAHVWPLRSVLVYGRDEVRRRAFADTMGEELGLDIVAASDLKEAVCEAGVVVLATKNRVPVVEGTLFAPRTCVLSIGSTRPVLRELDRATLARAGTVVVDDVRQVLAESGDIIDSVDAGVLTADDLLPVARAASEPHRLRTDGVRDLLVFKSVGTALQDLALARIVLAAATESGCGHDLGTLLTLKPSAG